MRENQLFIDKATALFFNLEQRYGIGEMYQSVVIKQFNRHFDCRTVQINGVEITIGILHQRFLTTVIFCNEIDAFKKDNTSSIAFTLYAGKLAPKSERQSYPNTMKLVHTLEGDMVSKVLNAQEIILLLGQTDLKKQFPEKMNEIPMLEIIFDPSGKITEVKKGL